MYLFCADQTEIIVVRIDCAALTVRLRLFFFIGIRVSDITLEQSAL